MAGQGLAGRVAVAFRSLGRGSRSSSRSGSSSLAALLAAAPSLARLGGGLGERRGRRLDGRDAGRARLPPADADVVVAVGLAVVVDKVLGPLEEAEDLLVLVFEKRGGGREWKRGEKREGGDKRELEREGRRRERLGSSRWPRFSQIPPSGCDKWVACSLSLRRCNQT